MVGIIFRKILPTRNLFSIGRTERHCVNLRDSTITQTNNIIEKFKRHNLFDIRGAAVSCSSVPYRLGGVRLGSGMTGKLGRAWHRCMDWCMGIIEGTFDKLHYLLNVGLNHVNVVITPYNVPYY